MDETREAARFILQFTQAAKMIHAVRVSLDMSEKHRGGARHSHLVPSAMHLGPFLRAFFATTDLLTHGGVENLRAAAGDRTQSPRNAAIRRVSRMDCLKHARRGGEFRWP
jgi:hypothetical protein